MGALRHRGIVPRPVDELEKEKRPAAIDVADGSKKEAEFYRYDGDDHNIAGHFSEAMRRSQEFFDRLLK